MLDPALLKPSGAARANFLYGCLRELDEALGGKLLVVKGDPADVVPRIATAVGAQTVHVAADYGPYGRERDEQVEKALAEDGVELVRTGSPYAVAPGRVEKGTGGPFKVFHPVQPGVGRPRLARPAGTDASTCTWMDPADKSGGPRAVRIPDDEPVEAELPEAGEAAALARWADFLDEGVADYGSARDLPAERGTSGMSPYLKYGCVHPRTLLADLAKQKGDSVKTYRTEIAWREFYADVLYRPPGLRARENYDKAFDHLPLRTGKAADADFERGARVRTDGLPDRRRRDAPAAGARRGCTTGCG
ncbi:deoxyribodipyrimidine photo-lyase [Pseudonocardia sp. ICBG601]|uniref:deoxyribodipyrimidine photo-lyase n=1 Tax=Pseudonocardia sp. ICBG601 TaxID=2846759 RepID=UPI0027E27EC9|nr:deoxyribodipyrimidine photo-lyase [Pseudonocardia sp. ICBG601]